MIAKIRELNLDDLKSVAGGATALVTMSAAAQVMAAPHRTASGTVVTAPPLNIPKLPTRL